MEKEKIEKLISEYIEAYEMISEFYRGSDSVFRQLIEERPDIKQRWEIAKQQREFSRQVDDVIEGNRSQYNALKVCDTPQILLDIGLERLPMLFTQKHLKDCMHPKSQENPHYHGISVEQIKNLPYLLESPAMILDSISRSDSILIVLGETDEERLPLIVSVRPGGVGVYELETVESNFITSVYGKNRFDRFIENTYERGSILYINQKRSQELFKVSRLPLPGCLNNLGFDFILCKSRNIVKADQPVKAAVNQKKAREISEARNEGMGHDTDEISGKGSDIEKERAQEKEEGERKSGNREKKNEQRGGRR